MEDMRRAWRNRVLLGGVAGIAVLIPLGGVFNDIVSGGLIAMDHPVPFRLVSGKLAALTGGEISAFLLQLCLYFALGAVVGVATLPFADDGKTLVARSLAHFAVTAGLLTLTCMLLGWAWSRAAMGVYLLLLGLVYLVIWGVRWVGWYFELEAIREKLGLKDKKKGRDRP